jgi:hypothetical protein
MAGGPAHASKRFFFFHFYNSILSSIITAELVFGDDGWFVDNLTY